MELQVLSIEQIYVSNKYFASFKVQAHLVDTDKIVNIFYHFYDKVTERTIIKAILDIESIKLNDGIVEGKALEFVNEERRISIYDLKL